MPILFPDSPVDGDRFTEARGFDWVYNGYGWCPEAPVSAIDASWANALDFHIADLTDSSKVLYYRTSNTQFEIYSLSKLEAVLLILKHKRSVLDTESVTYVSAEDNFAGSTAPLSNGDVLLWRDLLKCILTPSANNAAQTAARVLGAELLGGSPTVAASRAEFVAQMNAEAAARGFSQTSYTTAHGGVDGNVSVIDELAQLVRIGLTDPDIAAACDAVQQTVNISAGPSAPSFTVDHTSPMLKDTAAGAAKDGGFPTANKLNAFIWTMKSGDKVLGVINAATQVYDSSDEGTEYRYVEQRLFTERLGDDWPEYGNYLVASPTKPVSGYRYVGIALRGGSNLGGYVAVGQLEFRESPRGESVTFTLSTAGGGTGTGLATEERSGFGAEEGFNLETDLNDAWSPEQHPVRPMLLVFDAGVGNTINPDEVIITARADPVFFDQGPWDFDVIGSNIGGTDPADYDTLWNVRNQSIWTSQYERRRYKAPWAGADAASPGAQTHWAIEVVTGGNTSGFLSIADVQLLNAAGTNLATGGTASSTQERTGFEASKAFDGLDSTAWSPNQNDFVGQQLRYVLPSADEVVKVRLTCRDSFADQMVGAFNVVYSTDGWATTQLAQNVVGEVAMVASQVRDFELEYG